MRQNAKHIAERIEEQEIARDAAALSEPAFQVVWDNPEDDAFDNFSVHPQLQ